MTWTETNQMTVGELARRTGVSAKALREYTDWGLINTLGRNGANYRLYEPQALWCVRTISELRSLGLTLAEIRELPQVYAGGDPAAVGAWLAARLRTARARVEEQITRLQRTRTRIDAFEAEHASELAGCGRDPLWREADPPAA